MLYEAMHYKSSFVQCRVLALVNVVQTQLCTMDVFNAVQIHGFVPHWKHPLYKSMDSSHIENIRSMNPGSYNVNQYCTNPASYYGCFKCCVNPASYNVGFQRCMNQWCMRQHCTIYASTNIAQSNGFILWILWMLYKYNGVQGNVVWNMVWVICTTLSTLYEVLLYSAFLHV